MISISSPLAKKICFAVELTDQLLRLWPGNTFSVSRNVSALSEKNSSFHHGCEDNRNKDSSVSAGAKFMGVSKKGRSHFFLIFCLIMTAAGKVQCSWYLVASKSKYIFLLSSGQTVVFFVVL